MNIFGTAVARAVAPTPAECERDRIRHELEALHFTLELRRVDAANLNKLIGLLEDKIRDRNLALHRMIQSGGQP